MDKLIIYAELAGISIKDLKSKSQKRNIVSKRKTIWYILKEVDGISFPKIAIMFNKNSHTTVMSGVRSVKDLLFSKDQETRDLLLSLGMELED